MSACAYHARTTHSRAGPPARHFAYRLFYLLLDIDRIGADTRALKLLSYNKPNLFSFYDCDHGAGARGDLRAWATGAFANAGITVDGGKVMLLTLPRVLGFVFNPLSVFFGFDASGALRGVLYEVRNTFGEAHTYVSAIKDGDRATAKKVFHVSPFFDVRGDYRFSVRAPDERLSLVVENLVAGVTEHVATLTGQRAALSDRALIGAFFSLPLMTLGVVAAIHWQAFKLWLAGARYRQKPPAPAEAFSLALPQIKQVDYDQPMIADPERKAEPASAGLIAGLKDAPASAKAVLLACLPLRRGRLEMTLPYGRRLSFGGADPGPEARMDVRDYAFAKKVLSGGDIGFADGYIAGLWDTPDLSSVLEFFSLNAEAIMRLLRGNWVARAANMFVHRRHDNNRKGARQNIHEHYDLGNRFYETWLDPTMTYSSACFAPGDDLTAGQINKYRALAEKLDLQPGEHVLEIGCGWGGFAEIAARDYGARVTGLTLSSEQLDYARARMAKAGLSGSVDIKLLDYRDIGGSFDKIASIEMFEAVGERYWPAYFAKVAALLKPGGRAALQIITIRDELFGSYRNRADFIQRYIFPGGMLPSVARLKEEAAHAGLAWERMQNFGEHYATTLAQWGQRFTAHWDEIKTLGFDERFKRLWRFYLSYCEAGFRTSRTDVVQVALAKA